jgi:hypothetical protein
MNSQSRGDILSDGGAKTAVLSVILAIAILIAIGLASRAVPPLEPTPTQVTMSTIAEDWPAIPPTFTPTSSPTPRRMPSPTPTFTPTPTPTPLPPPTWSELGHLTSVVYTGTTVVEVERGRSGMGRILGSDHVLLMAVGRIHMGIDLTSVEYSDVEIEGTSLVVTLPHATVDSVELLPEQSRIFDSGQSWLFSQYGGIEVEALDEARAQLTGWARNNSGMLDLAEQIGRLQLMEFLHQLGFEEVKIIFK